jgi:Flp pilus assembly protein TadG
VRSVSGSRENGMVTAELAAALPVLLIVLAVAVTAVAVVGARIRVQDAAREAARAVARGDSATAHRLVAQDAPGAALTVGSASGLVTAVVRERFHPLASWLPAVEISADAVAAAEPSAPP